jgi:hypothetical protein
MSSGSTFFVSQFHESLVPVIEVVDDTQEYAEAIVKNHKYAILADLVGDKLIEALYTRRSSNAVKICVVILIDGSTFIDALLVSSVVISSKYAVELSIILAPPLRSFK